MKSSCTCRYSPPCHSWHDPIWPLERAVIHAFTKMSLPFTVAAGVFGARRRRTTFVGAPSPPAWARAAALDRKNNVATNMSNRDGKNERNAKTIRNLWKPLLFSFCLVNLKDEEVYRGLDVLVFGIQWSDFCRLKKSKYWNPVRLLPWPSHPPAASKSFPWALPVSRHLSHHRPLPRPKRPRPPRSCHRLALSSVLGFERIGAYRPRQSGYA